MRSHASRPELAALGRGGGTAAVLGRGINHLDSAAVIGEDAPPEARTRAEHSHSLVKALLAVPSLSPCDEQTLLCIVGDSVNLVWPAGRTIFERGSPADGLFIVLSGSVRILSEEGVELAQLGPGEYFGELSLLTGTTHQHAAEAIEDTELMVVPRERFDSLLTDNPELAAGIRRKAEQRIEANRGMTPTD